MKKIILFSLIVMLGISSCSSLKNNIDKLSPPPFYPVLDLMKSNDDYALTVLFKNNRSTIDSASKFYHNIDSVEVQVWDENDNFIMNIKIDTLLNMGIPTKAAKTYALLFGKNSINKLDLVGMEKWRFWTIIYEKENKYALSFSYSDAVIKGRPILDLYPVVLSVNADEIDCGLFVVRNKLIEENIPNSELMRLEVLNDKGKTVFSSNKGKNYMQVISPVYPENVGDYYLYDYKWDYKNNEGNIIQPGRYTINMTIPAQPAPYPWEFTFIKEANDK